MARAVLSARAVRTAETATDRVAAIHRCADVLEEIGAVAPGYRQEMLARERVMSTYLGEGVAIPHGLDTSRRLVRRDALAVLRFPDGVDWGNGRVTVCVAIAARGDGHIELLAALAEILLDPPRARALRSCGSAWDVVQMINRAVVAGYDR
ncbi:PTS sugar transporter subunit IIA [Jidongwangia harbinensis]|uniref:PTS sugar transporter subunit IIA n=1 Tax=Jidongwangia harbinensis TaxID=2878561 RepID=UPI001CD92D48|nr:PTS sugar transporter subunit IIA [Jidongwangia harbinensis]MCA2214407.1 PTS sugar transporter subunit IIA [Jidongwangia harbinensis]